MKTALKLFSGLVLGAFAFVLALAAPGTGSAEAYVSYDNTKSNYTNYSNKYYNLKVTNPPTPHIKNTTTVTTRPTPQITEPMAITIRSLLTANPASPLTIPAEPVNLPAV